MSNCSDGENKETYVVLLVEILYLLHRERLYALSLYVRVKTVLAILCGISKSEAASRTVHTSTASSGHGVSSCRTATRYRAGCW